MQRRTFYFIGFVVIALVLVALGSSPIASAMTSGSMAGGEEFVDLSSRIVPNLLVLSLAIMLAWALFGKRY
jgi:hypothetical protein